MEGNISMSSATHQAERLRRLRLLASEMPPGRGRDHMYDQLNDEATALASSRLIKG
jgi:hypothetical protein